jgi:hypothetical protein
LEFTRIKKKKMADIKKLIGNAMSKANSFKPSDDGKMKTKSVKQVPYKTEELNYNYSSSTKNKKGEIERTPILPNQYEKLKSDFSSKKNILYKHKGGEVIGNEKRNNVIMKSKKG